MGPVFPALRHTNEDAPLIAFTLQAQTAVGFFVAMLCVVYGPPFGPQLGPDLRPYLGPDLGPYLGPKLGTDSARGLGTVAQAAGTPEWLWFVMPGLMAAGLICSLGHLRSFRNPGRALTNLRSSWLSREVLFAVLFLATSLVFAVTRTAGAPAVALAVAAAGSGLGLLGCMASVYRLRTVPAWSMPFVAISFFVTSGLLGCLSAGTSLLAVSRSDATCRPALAAALAASFLLTLQLWLQRRWLDRLNKGPEAARVAWRSIHGAHVHAPRLRAALAGTAALLALAAAAAIGMGDLAPARWGLNVARSAFVGALALASVSEVLGRILLFRARVREGL